MFSWLTPDVLQGILRHILTFGGGFLIAKGHASQAQIDALVAGVNDPTLIGAVTAGVGIVMSYIHKQQTAATLATAVAAPAVVATVVAAPVAAK